MKQLHRPGRAPAGSITIITLFLLLLLVACRPASAATTPGEDTGRAIQNKGSDTLVNVALRWAETYREVKPDVSIAVTGGGSGTGIAALVNGTVDIANASRPMKESEIEAARANGIEPVEFTVAIDALAIVVHPDNPVNQLSIPQLSDIYTGRITNWAAVGGNDAPIVLLSRETNSGTHVYFLEEVVRKGDSDNTDIFAPQTLLMPSSVGITSEIQRNPRAIGYDGLGYVSEHEKMLEVAEIIRPRLIQDGMFMVGLDIVKDKLMEINVFSPGGMQIAERLYNAHFAREIVCLLEHKVEYRHQHRENFNNVEIATAAPLTSC